MFVPISQSKPTEFHFKSSKLKLWHYHNKLGYVFFLVAFFFMEILFVRVKLGRRFHFSSLANLFFFPLIFFFFQFYYGGIYIKLKDIKIYFFLGPLSIKNTYQSFDTRVRENKD